MNKIFSIRKNIWKLVTPRNSYSTLKQKQKISDFRYDMRFLDNFLRPSDSEIFSILVHWPFDYSVFSKIQNLSTFSLIADGAANKLSNLFASMPAAFRKFPDAVVGDFDSVNQEALDFFRLNKVNIINNPCQNNSDSEKCLLVFEEWFNSKYQLNPEKTYNIIICGGLGGRIDHVLNNFNVSYKFAKKFAEEGKRVNVLLLDNNSIATCLLPGKTTYIKASHFEKKEGCGLFPLLSKAHVTTKGLKWNLTKEKPLQFGLFTSSSNDILGDIVEIENDEPVMWTTTNILHDKYRRLKQQLMKEFSMD